MFSILCHLTMFLLTLSCQTFPHIPTHPRRCCLGLRHSKNISLDFLNPLLPLLLLHRHPSHVPLMLFFFFSSFKLPLLSSQRNHFPSTHSWKYPFADFPFLLCFHASSLSLFCTSLSFQVRSSSMYIPPFNSFFSIIFLLSSHFSNFTRISCFLFLLFSYSAFVHF